MGQVFEQLIGHWVQEWIGFAALMCGVLIAFGLWCLDYVVYEWQHNRRVTSAASFVAGLLFLSGGVYLSSISVALVVKTSLIGLMYYYIFRKIRKAQQATESTS